ncbi:MAG: hypothetical protein H7144_02415 [Burkholderiales bacterium]|nr:hypothetical protein [Phycisphaerae bacterium]
MSDRIKSVLAAINSLTAEERIQLEQALGQAAADDWRATFKPVKQIAKQMGLTEEQAIQECDEMRYSTKSTGAPCKSYRRIFEI